MMLLDGAKKKSSNVQGTKAMEAILQVKSYYVTAEQRSESGHNLGKQEIIRDVYAIGTKNHWNENEIGDKSPIFGTEHAMERKSLERSM